MHYFSVLAAVLHTVHWEAAEKSQNCPRRKLFDLFVNPFDNKKTFLYILFRDSGLSLIYNHQIEPLGAAFFATKMNVGFYTILMPNLRLTKSSVIWIDGMIIQPQ